jgi:Na+/melibiose symporter-like transporter
VLNRPRPLSLGLLIAYGLPGFALAMPTIPAYIFLPAVYGAALGLNAAGLALLVSRSLDVLIDPIVGALSDRLRTRWGRRKPWIAVGGVIGGFALIKLFQPPADVGVAYLVVWSMLLYLGWTLVAIPYTAWGAELTGDYHERARITAVREGITLLGTVTAGAVPAVIAGMGRPENDALLAISWMAVLLGAPFFALLLWRVPESPSAAVAGHETTAGSLRGLLRALGDNRPFLRLLIAWFVNSLANGIPAALFLLYLEHALHASQAQRSGLILAYFIAGVASIPLWLRVSARYGKHRAWCFAMIATCIAFAFVPLLAPGQIAAFTAICLVTGLGLGADLALPPALQADVVDYDTLRHGQPRAGLFFALWSMSTKLSLAVGVGIAFPALAAFGFKVGSTNSDRAVVALAVIYAWIPVVLKVIAITLVWAFPITPERQRVIRRRLDSLAARGQANSKAGVQV